MSGAADDPHSLVLPRIGLLGDVHGDFGWMRTALKRLSTTGVQQIHALGDFGFVWHGSGQEVNQLRRMTEILASQDAHLYVTEGNHEGYSALERLYPRDEHGYRQITDRITWLPRGWRGRTQRGTVVASLGGANSIDRGYRKPPRDGRGGSWWPEEQITEHDLDRLGHERADILLGHEAPDSHELRQYVDGRDAFWPESERIYASESRYMFKRATDNVRPRLTISGHYHRWMDFTTVYNRYADYPRVMRCVVFDCDGSDHGIAVLEVDEYRIDVVPRKPTRLTDQETR